MSSDLSQAINAGKTILPYWRGKLESFDLLAAQLWELDQIRLQLQAITGITPPPSGGGGGTPPPPVSSLTVQLVQSRGLENHWFGTMPYTTSPPVQNNGLFDIMKPPAPQVAFADLFLLSPTTDAYIEINKQINTSAVSTTAFPTPVVPATQYISATGRLNQIYVQGVSAGGNLNI